MLARVTPQALSALPGVFIVVPTKRGGGKGASGQVESDPELDGSNVLSVGEGVLLKWLSYHLEQANRVNSLRLGAVILLAFLLAEGENVEKLYFRHFSRCFPRKMSRHGGEWTNPNCAA